VALVVVVVAAGFAAAEPATSIATVFCAEDLCAPVLASVIKADVTATEYLLQCGVPFEDGRRRRCGHATNDTLILTLGPSTMALMGRDKTFTRGFDCRLQGSSSARYDFFLDGEYALQRSHFPYQVELDEHAKLMVPLTITAGLEKLAAATASGGNQKAVIETTSTALPRSMATRLDAPEATILDDTSHTKTKTTIRRMIAPTSSSSYAETKPTDPSPALTTADKPGSTAAMLAFGRMLGLVTALGVL